MFLTCLNKFFDNFGLMKIKFLYLYIFLRFNEFSAPFRLLNQLLTKVKIMGEKSKIMKFKFKITLND